MTIKMVQQFSITSKSTSFQSYQSTSWSNSQSHAPSKPICNLSGLTSRLLHVILGVPKKLFQEMHDYSLQSKNSQVVFLFSSNSISMNTYTFLICYIPWMNNIFLFAVLQNRATCFSALPLLHRLVCFYGYRSLIMGLMSKR